jgi:glycosyltransferase involved in cell wall biosynthesis
MLSQRIYFLLKPYIPWRLRMALRRVVARRKRAQNRDVWPVEASAALAPPAWPGWPEGKKFAVVLTHDVEGPVGLSRCRQLAELELGMGFRSSFTLIPEGAYEVPPSLRSWLKENGLEVGVHDLRHDGKLFWSKGAFQRNAVRINHYLRQWGARGFRSGFMLKNLDWLQQLDIEYDASTFDTDPFEPQSDGAGTIFPFWVSARAEEGAGPAPAGRGYVELPYTLPQDSTVFLILGEISPEIWLRKLDWVAQHGGMALINVHPDYMSFGGKLRRGGEYPAAHYKALLDYIQSQYAGQYWNPLPGQLARWYLGVRPAPPTTLASASGKLRGKRAAVLLYSTYPSDPRPRRAAEAMVEAGMEVDLLSLAESDLEPTEEMVNGVRVFRLRLKRARTNKRTYLRQYGRFFASSFWFLTRRGLMRRYDVIHVHNMPDFLVFSALAAKMRGSRIILDLHDPMPELMTTIFGLKDGHWLVRILRRVERWSIGFSDLALAPNLAFKSLFSSRSCPPEKVQIVMNSPQQEIFDPDRFLPGENGEQPPGQFRIMHHGSIVHRHGIDLLVEAVALVRPRITGVHLDIFGADTPFLRTVLGTAERLGVRDIVTYHGAKPQSEIAKAIRACHLGVVPNRRSVFTEINFPTRLFEYLAMHRPVLAPSTQGIRDYFGPGQLLMFEPNNVPDLAAKILWVWQNPEEAQSLVERGTQVYRQNLWNAEKARLLAHVASLMPAD